MADRFRPRTMGHTAILTHHRKYATDFRTGQPKARTFLALNETVTDPPKARTPNPCSRFDLAHRRPQKLLARQDVSPAVRVAKPRSRSHASVPGRSPPTRPHPGLKRPICPRPCQIRPPRPHGKRQIRTVSHSVGLTRSRIPSGVAPRQPGQTKQPAAYRRIPIPEHLVHPHRHTPPRVNHHHCIPHCHHRPIQMSRAEPAPAEDEDVHVTDTRFR